jgi:LysR family hydrogen peroxide-inducible transcriptional activator
MPEGHCFRSQVLAYCASDNDSQEGPVHFESGSFETLIRLVDEGLGATVLPDLVVQRLAERGQKSRVRPLVAPIPAREIGLVTARSDLRRKVSDALSSLVEDALKQKLKPTTSRTHVLSPLD